VVAEKYERQYLPVPSLEQERQLATQKALFPEVASSFFIPLFCGYSFALRVPIRESSFYWMNPSWFILLDALDPKKLTKKVVNKMRSPQKPFADRRFSQTAISGGENALLSLPMCNLVSSTGPSIREWSYVAAIG
jgi:hypothetical protein